MTTPAWWGAHLLERGDDSAVWARTDVDMTLGELRAGVAELDARFAREGIGGDSTVALRMPPSLTLLQALLALWSRGTQVMLTDARLKPAELSRLYELRRPQFTVEGGRPGQMVQGFRAAAEFTVRRHDDGRARTGDACLVQFSSGSTGRSKVIGRTARSILDELDRYAALPLMPAEGEHVVLLNSVIHTLGLFGGVLHGLNVGTTLVLPAGAQPSDVLRAAADTGAESLFGVPMHFDLLGRMAAVPLPALRLAVSAGEVLPSDVQQRFVDRFGVPISQVYGMTEVGIIASDLGGSHPPPAVGTPAPGIEVRELAGELSVRTPLSPYLTDEGADRWSDGWLRTFDRCTIDPATGVISITGRADATVVIGGLKVDLAEVEAVLREHPRIQEAVVVFGTVIEAHVGVDGRLTPADVIDWCRSRLSDHKIPKLVYPAPSVPRNAMGKLLRNRDLLHAARTSRPR